jgi:selenocysteine lyase/cysteine desulfurase
MFTIHLLSNENYFSLILIRTIIRNAVNASEHDAVIFAGSGSTAAVHKLIHALRLKTPPVRIFALMLAFLNKRLMEHLGFLFLY